MTGVGIRDDRCGWGYPIRSFGDDRFGWGSPTRAFGDDKLEGMTDRENYRGTRDFSKIDRIDFYIIITEI